MSRIITVNLSDELFNKLESIAQNEERSKSFFIKKGLEKILSEHEKQAKTQFLKTTKMLREKAKKKGIEKQASKLLKELGFEDE